ncbi:MAG: Ribosome-binding factor A [candidate division TM6 bacterium GW2011_GWF2_32_72]|nr:MAG: Ribosome-binding factor A [candidate division TM6 bacterium GW2011_GWF2_32_72]
MEVKDIKRAQKEALLLKEISQLIYRIVKDHPEWPMFSITRVELSSKKSICNMFFYLEGGPEKFKEFLEELKLYKPSIRATIAKQIRSRYVPDLVFKYDEVFEKQQRIEHLLDEVKSKETPK